MFYCSCNFSEMVGLSFAKPRRWWWLEQQAIEWEKRTVHISTVVFLQPNSNSVLRSPIVLPSFNFDSSKHITGYLENGKFGTETTAEENWEFERTDCLYVCRRGKSTHAAYRVWTFPSTFPLRTFTPDVCARGEGGRLDPALQDMHVTMESLFVWWNTS